jgi:hypothetical protein
MKTTLASAFIMVSLTVTAHADCQAAFDEFVASANNAYFPLLKKHFNAPPEAGQSYFNAGGVKQVAELLGKAKCVVSNDINPKERKEGQIWCVAKCESNIGKTAEGDDSKIMYFTVQNQQPGKQSKYFIYNMYPVLMNEPK